ncbi:hypothetical protein CEP54_011364 [Fusarium duplospermum]|uniref:Pisatin demethylase n=1 Tax=Fusarium duplospermum TaxID=1325734 RepID=A0A428PEN6_9HYPO|nr:hypothetical protein CEP54_011364 [Fusarium duplospermum]
MFISSFISTHLDLLAGFLVLSLLAKLIYNRYGHGISHIPGPFLASISDLWRLYIVWGRRPDIDHVKLHKRHGKLVRLGPNAISVSDPSAIRQIYGLASGFKKSDFYTVQQTLAKGRPLFTLFTSTDTKFHAKLRRSVSSAYAMSTLVDMRFKDQQEPCDFGKWLQFYAFDVIGELTYSKSIEWMLDYASVVGQMPIIDSFLLKNPIRLFLSRLGLIGSTTPMVTFARQRFSERVDLSTGQEKSSSRIDASSTRRDFLSQFLEAHKKDPDFVTSERVLALTVANIFAGSDTTAISLRPVFYFLLKNPEELERLMIELDEQKRTRKFRRPDGLVDWEEARDLPVLGAVIKEALRIHPAAGLILERITPPQGVKILDKFIPWGTIIGCNAWTIHRDVSIFGSDPDKFRPLRWLEASPDQRRLMDNCLFTFGAGSRTCIGKNISLLEIYKLIPALLMRQLELPSEDSDWKLHNAWFVKQSDFFVRFKSRGYSA